MRKLLIAITFILGAVNLHAQACAANVYLSTFETSSPVVHQASVTVVMASNYGVPGGYDSTLRAGELVELKDGSYIKSGSTFLAEIGPCTKSKKQSSNSPDNFGLTAYPNPVISTLNLSVNNLEISKVTVTTLDGKVILSKDSNDEYALQLNFENYPSGIYLLTVNTSNGNTFQEKIVKE